MELETWSPFLLEVTTYTSMTSSLRTPGAILLVSCYELGHQPIGIAQPMGFLVQAGYSPTSLDLSVQDLDDTRIRAAKLIGISVPMHTALTLGVRLAKHIRDINPHTHLCFYGLYASLNARYLLEEAADSVIGGEFEVPLLQLLEKLEPSSTHEGQDERSGSTAIVPTPRFNIPAIPGVSLKHSLSPPSITRHPWRTDLEGKNRDKSRRFPLPQRETLPSLTRYAKLDYQGTRKLAGYVEASRGCLHACLHCPIVPVYNGRFFLIPERVVLADIKQQVDMGAAHITFGDPDFFNGPKHSLNILRAMHREFPTLTFDLTTKIEHILRHRDVFEECAALGCLFIISAVESFSNTVLHHLEKGHTRNDIFTALDILRHAGITLRPSLVAFTPWTTLSDYVEMLELVESHHLIDATDPVQYSVRLLVPPGSALLNPPATHANPIQQVLTHLDQSKFQHLWKHPDPRMDDLYHSVTARVEMDAKHAVDSVRTFDCLRALAHDAAGIPQAQPCATSREPSRATNVPRLTEPWFCCAEPTQQQYEPLQSLPPVHGRTTECRPS